jgi:hypothetical protein
MDNDMNEEQELAALEAELAALEDEAKARVEETHTEPEPEPVAAEAPRPKKKKSPKASDVVAKPEDPKAAAIRQYGAQRLASMRASKGLR